MKVFYKDGPAAHSIADVPDHSVHRSVPIPVLAKMVEDLKPGEVTGIYLDSGERDCGYAVLVWHFVKKEEIK